MKVFCVKPQPVVRVWGGSRLISLRRFGEGAEPIGESWEVFGESREPETGHTLDELAREMGSAFLGSWCENPGEGFPLLTKWLDCQEWLSIQVHPDDSVARRLEGPGQRGKSEAWYFCEVAQGAEVIHGWQDPSPSAQELAGTDWADSHWVERVRRFHPMTGEWVYTPPGTVHALGPGLLVFEVQQCSDLTYRLYDWGRVGLDGLPRQIHPRQGRVALSECPPELAVSPPVDGLGTLAILCPHFSVEMVEGSRRWDPAGRSVELLTLLEDAAELVQGARRYPLQRGDSVVVPASAGAVEWNCDARARWFRVRLSPSGKESPA